ncbi:MAG: zinc-binding dehydrogenase [Phycisphaerales bacterium]|nr:zinc-binding dehydrogenase [Phycisphaerales bacterium]
MNTEMLAAQSGMFHDIASIVHGTGAACSLTLGLIEATYKGSKVGRFLTRLFPKLVSPQAGRIVAVDPNAEKLALAQAIGATDCVQAGGAGAVETVRELTGGGVDHAIDASSSLDGFGSAFEATRRGGSTVTTSLTHPSQKFSFPVARIVAEARTIKGSYIGTCVPGRDIPAFIRLYRQGRMPVDKLVTRTLRLDEINEAFDALSEARVVRQVITF